jgi:hypothetical protein
MQQAKVEVERGSDSFNLSLDLSLDLSLNLQKAGGLFQHPAKQPKKE